MLKKKTYIIEGGAYGHMEHPFTDNELTFGDLKTIIKMALSGNLDLEEEVKEKTDGQNLMVSWKNGKLIAARNKGHLKNYGENALDKEALKQKFQGRGELSKAFSYAVDDLDRKLSALPEDVKESFFANGKRFLDLEVIWPDNANVIPYGRKLLVLHGVYEYDEKGNVIKRDTTAAKKLAELINSVNKNIETVYDISAPAVVKLPRIQNFDKLQRIFIKDLENLQRRYNLKDSDLVVQYHVKWWENFIKENAKKAGYKIPDNILSALIRRWVYYDKSYSLTKLKKEIDNEQFLKWVLKVDKEDFSSIFRKNIRPFEIIFLRLGVEILKNMENILVVNKEEAAQAIRKELESTIKEIRASKDLTKIRKLEQQLQRLNSIGGMDAILPTEGIVFTYKGKVYKLTGAFSPVNSILGMLKYTR